MHPVMILLVGVAIVIGGVLVLRLHAMLALILAALVVSGLTPTARVQHYHIEKNAVKIISVGPSRGEVLLDIQDPQLARPAMRYLVLRDRDGKLEKIGELAIVRHEKKSTKKDAHATSRLVASDVSVELDLDDIVIHPLEFKRATKLAQQTVGERVAEGFGGTCTKIGILIAMAAIIGKCLLDSGSADRIVRSALNLLGEKQAPAAFLGSGFLLGIPVFFDTVFYLMIPLGKALRMRTGRNYLLYVLTIVAGATMAHSLVPPTPGPLFVAEQLSVDLGLMMVAGCCVGVFTSGAGYLFAQWVNRRTELPLRESTDLSLADLKQLAQRDESLLPPLWLAVLPILLPVVLIGGNTVIKSFSSQLSPVFMSTAATLGNKNIALVISATLAMATLVWQRRSSFRDLAETTQAALANGGVIILITASGGAFGTVIQQTGVASLIRELPTGSPLMVIVLAFFITTAVRSAQGSATVAMITAVGILSGLANAQHLGYHPVYIALAIGCGSKPIAWMNDSGFWVICKMSGMTESEGLRFITPMSIIMGLVGLVVTLLGAWLLPLTAS